MVEFKGRAQWKAYLQAVDQVEGGTISPGGAASLLGVSRQMVHRLVTNGRIRTWDYYETWSLFNQPTYRELSVRDVIAYGVSVGRISSVEDCGLRFPGLEEEIERAKG